MTKEELKTVYKLAKIFLISGFILWGIETLFFIIYEGWHLKATNPMEIILDKSVLRLWNTGFSIIGFLALSLILNLNKKD